MADNNTDGTTVIERVNEFRRIHGAPQLTYDSILESVADSVSSRVVTAATKVTAVAGGTQQEIGVVTHVVFATARTSPPPTDTEAILSALDVWYGQSARYNFASPGGGPTRNPDTRGFTHLVWRNARRVGMFVARSRTATCVAMAVDPSPTPASGPNTYAAQVLPQGIRLGAGGVSPVSATDAFYTKQDSDVRFLSADGLDAFVDRAAAEGVHVATSNAAALRRRLDDSYYKRYEVDRLFDTEVLQLYEGLSNWFVDGFYTRPVVDSRLGELDDASVSRTSELSNALSAATGGLDLRVDGLSNDTQTLRQRLGVVQTQSTTFAPSSALAALASRLNTDYSTSAAISSSYTSLEEFGNESNAIRRHLVDEYYDKEASDGRFAGSDLFLRTSNHFGESRYDKDECDELFARSSKLDELSNMLNVQHYTSSEADARFASTGVVLDLGTELREEHMDAASSRAEFASACNVRALRDDVYSRTDADTRFARSDDHAALSNTVALDYLDRHSSDQRYVEVGRFASFSNLVRSDDEYLSAEQTRTSFASAESYRSTSNAFRQHVRSTDSNLNELFADTRRLTTDGRALSNFAHGLDFYDVQESDARFGTLSAQTAIADSQAFLTARLNDEYYDIPASDALFARAVDLQDLREATYDRVTSDDRFPRLHDFRGLSNEYSARTEGVDARGHALSNHLYTEYYTASDSRNVFAGADDFAALTSELRTEYSTTEAIEDRFLGFGAFEGLSNLLRFSYDNRDEASRRFASASNLDNLDRQLKSQYITEEQSRAVFAEETRLASLSDAFTSDLRRLEEDVSTSLNFVRTSTTLAGVSNDDRGLLLFTREGTEENVGIRFAADNSNAELMRLDGTGRLGIGTSSPEHRLHVEGDIFTSGTLITMSDSNFKRSVRPITDAIDKVRRIGGYTYEMRSEKEETQGTTQGEAGEELGEELGEEDGVDARRGRRGRRGHTDRGVSSRRRHAGVLAQEVIDVLPEAVCVLPMQQNNNEHHDDGSGDKLGVSYRDLIALLVEAVKQLSRGMPVSFETVIGACDRDCLEMDVPLPAEIHSDWRLSSGALTVVATVVVCEDADLCVTVSRHPSPTTSYTSLKFRVTKVTAPVTGPAGLAGPTNTTGWTDPRTRVVFTLSESV